MSRLTLAGEFFVAGEPVEPNRPCYVERSADRRLAGAVAARRTALVFGPPALGKTSLIIRCAARLHTAGECVAYVDLADPSLEGDGGTPGWCHEIGARIAQNCGLRPEPADSRLEAYAAQGGRALADFLWQVVLTNTTKPITVFVDSIEHVAGTERARIVFDMIGACRLRRSEEPDYGRITFVVAGIATRRQLWTATAGAPPFPFDAIALGDFTPREAYKLARGFGGDNPQTRALLDRILTWTSGHPYLTQKIARGVAAKGGRLEHVEQVVEAQLLAPHALAEEPLFADVRRRLERDSRPVRQARALLAAIANGREQAAQAEAAALDELVLAGLVSCDENGGSIRFRNRVLREVFTERVVVGNSTKRHVALAAAVLAAAGVLGTFWYTQRLPQPAVAVLSSIDAPLPALAAAHAELNALPGFTERANELYVAALVERSAAAETFSEAAAVDELLASAGYEALATRLLGEFWLRRAAAAAHAGERDAALLYAVKAETAAARRPIEVAPFKAASTERAAPAAAAESVADAAPRARATLAMLAGHDYAALEYSGRFADEPLEQRIDWRDSSFTLRYGGALRRVPLTAAPVALSPAAVPTALAPNPLVREILVQEDGSAGSFVLELEIEHADLGELTATLTAPSGAWVELPVTPRVAQGAPIVATPGSTLGALADEARGGTWRLAIVDRRTGRNGSLRTWRLAFSAERTWVDAPPRALAIPDPARTEQVIVTLSESGRYAVARPAEPGGVDTVAVWEVTAGALVAELALTAPVTAVELSPDDARLLVVTGDALTLWDTAAGREIARIETQTAFLRAPLFAVDGSHFLIAERSDSGAPLVSLLRAADGALVTSREGIVPGDSAVLGPNASFLAFVSGPRTVTLLDPRVGQGHAELEHAQAVVALWPVASEGVLTVDAAGALRVWPLARNVTQTQARFLGTTVDAGSVSVAARSTRVAYAAARGHVLVRDARDGALLFDARAASSGPPAALLAPAGDALVTLAGTEFRYWSLRGAASDVPDGTGALDVAAVALDGTGRLVIGSRDGSVRTVAAAEPGEAASRTIAFLGHTAPVSVLAAASEAGVAASGARDGSVRVWSLTNGEPDATVLRHGSEPVTALALARDGKWLASGTLSGVRLFALGAVGFKDRTVSAGVRALAFTPNGERVAVGAGDGTLLLVHAASGDARTVSAGAAPIQSVAFAPQGDIFASGDAAGGVRLWRTATLSAQGEAHGVREPVRWLGFGPDGGSLFVVTDHWVHRLRVTDRRLEPVASRRSNLAGGLAPAIAANGSETLAIAGLDARGVLTRFDIDLETPLPSAPMPRGPRGPDPDRLRGRDWTSILGLVIDDDGRAVPVSQR